MKGIPNRGLTTRTCSGHPAAKIDAVKIAAANTIGPSTKASLALDRFKFEGGGGHAFMAAPVRFSAACYVPSSNGSTHRTLDPERPYEAESSQLQCGKHAETQHNQVAQFGYWLRDCLRHELTSELP